MNMTEHTPQKLQESQLQSNGVPATHATPDQSCQAVHQVYHPHSSTQIQFQGQAHGTLPFNHTYEQKIQQHKHPRPPPRPQARTWCSLTTGCTRLWWCSACTRASVTSSASAMPSRRFFLRSARSCASPHSRSVRASGASACGAEMQ